MGPILRWKRQRRERDRLNADADAVNEALDLLEQVDALFGDQRNAKTQGEADLWSTFEDFYELTSAGLTEGSTRTLEWALSVADEILNDHSPRSTDRPSWVTLTLTDRQEAAIEDLSTRLRAMTQRTEG